MIQTQKQSLSESEKETVHDWLTSPGADIFLRVIRSEQAFMQAETGAFLSSQWIPNTAGEVNKEKAEFFSDRAHELQFMIDKMGEMKKEDYQYYTATLTP